MDYRYSAHAFWSLSVNYSLEHLGIRGKMETMSQRSSLFRHNSKMHGDLLRQCGILIAQNGISI